MLDYFFFFFFFFKHATLMSKPAHLAAKAIGKSPFQLTEQKQFNVKMFLQLKHVRRILF